MQSKRTLFLIEVAIFSALALILDLIPFLSFKVWAQGGSISFAMIPIFIISYRWGLKGGLLSGLLFGVLQVISGTAWIAHPVQGLLDYPVAFTVLGFAGLFKTQAAHALKVGARSTFVKWVIIGVTLGSTLRFFSHYLAGVVFFDSLIDGMNIWLYSFVYNASYIIPSAIINIIAVAFLFSKRPALVKQPLNHAA
ncbi:thiamine transporter ThiT [Halolactibacillus alkaliphilus]|uniref:Thiamine transporter ThiT n=1 Tax=Halolactibacillus alkaliphilus TaxID=442899 RepID=A0A511WZM2_9BACI|nr:energy-coupled thiamine transporter ThiT [Halolactibacillus alkaliphilus]GEN56138.1 thiamine transporter ThiT [Halolactibacillus alkaliphilus]GGN66953.1 thiamine transporter ThiT [Halolactibacillus alkaliphilus]SFO71835.1 thiamine transporter [Halolactibacillus alkaliphilus]